MEEKTKWWKYPVAVIAFVVVLVVGSMVAYLINYVINIFSPPAFKNSEPWIRFISDIIAAAFACGILDPLTDEKHPTFCYIVCLAAMIYLLFTSISNFATGVSTLANAAPVAAAGITCLVFAIQYIKASAESREE